MRIIRRYKSEIRGNYRRAALVGGLVVGATECLYPLIRFLCNKPLAQPEDYVTAALLFAGALIVSYLYRGRLEGKSVTLKELMLLTVDLGIVAALLYGIGIYVYGSFIDTAFSARCVEHWLSAINETDSTEASINIIKSYQVINWSIMAFVRTALLSVLVALVVALVLRTEKSPQAPR